MLNSAHPDDSPALMVPEVQLLDVRPVRYEALQVYTVHYRCIGKYDQLLSGIILISWI